MTRGQIPRNIVICTIIVLSLLLSGCIKNNDGKDNNDIDSKEEWRDWPILNSSIEQWNGYSSENSTENVEFELTDYYVARVNVSLSWQDEPPHNFRYENQPDSFNISILTPWNETITSNDVSNTIGGFGQINLTINISDEDIANNSAIGEWIVTINCIECGNHEKPSGIGLAWTDSGNDWELLFYYEYHSKN